MKFPDPFLRRAAREKGMSPSERWNAFREALSLWEKLVGPEGWEKARTESRKAHQEIWHRMLALRDARR